MFYPVELLSHRRRGKLAPCWLAAIINEKLFKRRYNSVAINKINVVETCKEILQIIQLRSNNSSDRFSLFLSSHLMYGITRIHRYQIILYQKEVFEMQNNLDSVALPKPKRRKDRIDENQDLDFPAIECLPPSPPSPPDFLDFQFGPDLHILPGEDIDDRLHMVTQDVASLNFGCLTDKELNLMLEHNGDIPFDSIRHISQEKDISEKMADITITEGIQETQLSQEILSPVIVDISKRNTSQGGFSLTPQKRQPHQTQEETPTKRRRLSFETAVVAASSAPPEDLAIPAPDLSLEPLHSDYFMIHSRSKKRKIIDKKIALSDEQLQKWRQNIHICCKDEDKPPKNPKIPWNKLFNEPSHFPMRHNANLKKLFVDHTVGPFESENVDTAPAELMQFDEIIRVEETIDKLNLPTEDVSAFEKMDTVIAAEPIDSTANILQNIIHETVDRSRIPLPETIPDTVPVEEGTSILEHRPDQEKSNISNDESFEDIDILLEKQRRSSEIKHSSVFSTSPIRSSQPELTGQDILALLEVLWNDKEMVSFNELIPNDTYTKEDAATAFQILLDFYREKKIILQQDDFSEPLWIFKYPNYDDC